MSNTNKSLIEQLNNESVQALRSNEHQKAIELSQKLIELSPDHASAHAVQFSSLFKSEQFDEARRIGARAAQLNPQSVFVLNNQACLQLEAKQPAAAAGLLKSLIEQFGERAQWLYNLALAQRMVNNYEYAIEKFRRTLDHQPDHDRAAFQLADCLYTIGDYEEAVKAYDYVRQLRSKHAPTHSNFLHRATANNQLSAHELAQEFDLWRERFIPNEKRYTVDQPSDVLKIKTGFLIGAIPDNWLEYIVVPLIGELLNRGDHISVYWHDEKSASKYFGKEVNLILSSGMSDANFARQVRADKIDVMVDVCGMRQGSRQRALGLHLAGRQFGWLAHQGLYATPLVQPIDESLIHQRFYVAAESASKKIPLENTFIGLNAGKGLANEVIKAWAAILHRLPTWKLHINADNDHIIKLLRQRFAVHKVDEQLLFGSQFGASNGSIVLDNFVENDPVAAAHAMDAGGILITLKGPLFPAQQNAALLKQIGKENWVCDSTMEYISRAITLSSDETVEPLSKEQLTQSRIQNLQTFTTHFRDILSS